MTTNPAGREQRSARDGKEEKTLYGIGVAPGLAIGPAYLYAKDDFTVSELRLSAEYVEEEIARFEQAVRRAERDLQKIAGIARQKIGSSSAEIFEAQAMMLRDDALYKSVVDCIRFEHCNADYAVQTVISKHCNQLRTSTSEYFRERANDFLDIKNRLIRHLQRGKILSNIDTDSIVVAENLSAADIILFSRRSILGCIMDFGGPTSHVSIMARALGVPAVVGSHGLSAEVDNGEVIVLDGFSGKVVVNPSEETIARYREKQKRYGRLLIEQKDLLPLPSETTDGHRIVLRANAEFQLEVPLLEKHGAEGIGLFRTEMLFLTFGRPLSEEEQFKVYREIVEAVSPEPTTFRLIDLGGDKMLPLAHREHNPFLGWRGIRILLDRKELLEPQLRALMRTAAHGPTRILLPMISSIDELHQFRRILSEVAGRLQEEGALYSADIPVGIMVEVPAVALMAELFASQVDFFSIGTNDLTQYVLAVDRGNDLVSRLYSEFHPAVLQLIAHVIKVADEKGIPVSLCGEMAGSPRATPVLVGLGLKEFSASPAYLPGVKRVIRELSLVEAKQLAEAALAQPHTSSVIGLLDDWLRDHLGDLVQFLDGNNAYSAEA